MATYSNILKDKTIEKFDDKLLKIKDDISSDSMTREVAEVLYTFHMTTSNPSVTSKDFILAANRLCKTIIDVIELEDQVLFKDLFRLINIAFNQYKDTTFNIIAMNRFTDDWGDPFILGTYQTLVGIITLLCDYTTRKENKRRISLDLKNKPYIVEKSTLTPDNITRISNYYEM